MVNEPSSIYIEKYLATKKDYIASRTEPKRATSKAVTSPEDRLGENHLAPVRNVCDKFKTPTKVKSDGYILNRKRRQWETIRRLGVCSITVINSLIFLYA